MRNIDIGSAVHHLAGMRQPLVVKSKKASSPGAEGLRLR
jgi:hypothetical protein